MFFVWKLGIIPIFFSFLALSFVLCRFKCLLTNSFHTRNIFKTRFKLIKIDQSNHIRILKFEDVVKYMIDEINMKLPNFIISNICI